jgi:hypothetical protein
LSKFLVEFCGKWFKLRRMILHGYGLLGITFHRFPEGSGTFQLHRHSPTSAGLNRNSTGCDKLSDKFWIYCVFYEEKRRFNFLVKCLCKLYYSDPFKSQTILPFPFSFSFRSHPFNFQIRWSFIFGKREKKFSNLMIIPYFNKKVTTVFPLCLRACVEEWLW